MSLNKEIMLTGNVGKLKEDAAQYTDSGKFIFKFSLAVQAGWGDNKTTEWYDCVAWEKAGEILNQYIGQGSKVQVRGDFKQEFWKSREGEAKGKIVVTVKDFQFISAKKAEKEHEEGEPDFMRE
jgi:single-strand DNA-binding protein